VTRLRPALREVPPAARPLAKFIEQAGPALHSGGPVAEQLRQQLPDIRRSITGMRPLANAAVPALELVGRGLEAVRPIFRGLRIYAPDFVLGVTNGLAGVSSANYTRNGHYARLEFIQNPQTTIGGAFAEMLTKSPLIPGLTNVRTHLDARCPGANAPPAPDGSSPYVPDTSLCDPTQSVPAYVNEPPGRPSPAAPRTAATRRTSSKLPPAQDQGRHRPSVTTASGAHRPSPPRARFGVAAPVARALRAAIDAVTAIGGRG
jgi:hypothetical protein